AGATAEEAFATVRQLMTEGACATLDILGESVADAARATQFTRQYQELFPQIRALGLDSTVSVKLSMLGLELDLELAARNFMEVAQAAARHGVLLTIDMEDHTTTDATLELYRSVRARLDGIGAVLQAYLRRTLGDIAALPRAAGAVAPDEAQAAC